MSSWNDASMHEGGWGADASFATSAPVDSVAQRTGDKVPLPVTVLDLVQNPCTDDRFAVGQMRFSMVMFIGRVESVQELDAGCVVKIEVCDPSDPECRLTVNILKTFDDAPEDNVVVEGTLVMVVGKMRTSDDTTNILVLKTREVTDQREYECFKLEAQIARIYHEKGVADALRGGNFLAELRGCPAGPSAAAPVAAAPRHGNAVPVSTTTQQNRIYATKTSAVSGGPRQKVLDFLKRETPAAGENGLHIDDICQATSLGRQEVQSHLEYLTGEGEAFQTTDTEHYAVF